MKENTNIPQTKNHPTDKVIPFDGLVSPIGHGKKYNTIVVDPPWQYGKWGRGSKESCFKKQFNWEDTPLPYNYMSIEEIKALPVGSLANISRRGG